MASENYAQAVQTSKMRKPSGPKKIRAIEVEKAENGGHTVTHRFQHESDGPYHEAETHVFGASEGRKLLDHLKEHLGMKDAGEGAAAAAEETT